MSWRAFGAVVFVGILWSTQGAVRSQGNVPALAEGWLDLPAVEFVSSVERLRSANPYLANTKEISARAVQLLLGSPGLSATEPTTFQGLVQIAGASLTEADKQALAAALPAFEGLSQGDFSALKSRIEQQAVVSGDRAESARAIAEWCDGHDILPLSSEDLAWAVRNVTWPRVDIRDIRITWRGFVTAPQSGEYVFSVTPINPTYVQREVGPFGLENYQQSMRVVVNQQDVLSASPTRWQNVGRPVQLAAGTSVPISVEVTFQASSGEVYVEKALVAQLFWRGPGVVQGIVPPTAFFVDSDGRDPGLTVTYASTASTGASTQFVSVVPSVDLIARSGADVSPLYASQRQRLVDALVSRTLDDKSLDSFKAGAETIPLIQQSEPLAAILSSPQRVAISEKLLERPDILNVLTPRQIRLLYASLRHGSTDQAVEVVGTWMQSHSLPEAKISNNFFFANRVELRLFLIGMVRQFPSHIIQLEQQFLEAANGSCCLPAAYTIGYAYLVKGEIQRWEEILDARIASPAITSDARATWLIARAQAAEIRRCVPDIAMRDMEEYEAGIPFLERALNMAESDALRVHIIQEIVARLHCSPTRGAARAYLSKVAERIPRDMLTGIDGALAAAESDLASREQQTQLSRAQKYVAFVSRKMDTASDSERDDLAALLSGGQSEVDSILTRMQP